MLETEVLIIGAGAVGCALARELSKYDVSVIVVEKDGDIGGDASRSNSAIIHTGYDAAPGTLESRLVVAANPMYDQLAKELDIPFQRIGAVLPAMTDEQYLRLPALKEKAFQNHVYDVEYLAADQLLAMEPNLNPAVKAGLFIPRESIIDPFLLVVALAENAQQNGVTFLLNTRVTGISIVDGHIAGTQTSGGDIAAKYIINAAGLHGDEIAAMVGKNDYFVNPRKGQFYILDKNTSCKVNHIVLPIPTKLTKGKLMCPTIHGNMLVGPTAEDLTDKGDKSTTGAGLDSIQEEIRLLIPEVNLRDTITQYAGLRPNRNPEGLHVDTYKDVANYVNLSGIRSTGLTASVSIAKYVAQTLLDLGLPAKFNRHYNPVRQGIPAFHKLSREEQAALIHENPLFGNIVCRCESITEGEIVLAIHRSIPAHSMDAIKRRLRAGMGRCQGGFCGPRIIDILARELKVSPAEITKNEQGSYMVAGRLR